MDDEFSHVRDRVLARLGKLRPLEGIAATRDPQPADDAAVPTIHEAVPVDEVVAFLDAGWRFLSGDASRNEHGKRLFLDADGHLKIDAGALNLRFRPDADPASIETYLAEHALRVRRKLGFAPNLFLVSTETGEGMPDSVELAQKLTGEDEALVIYAEPVLIEGIGSR